MCLRHIATVSVLVLLSMPALARKRHHRAAPQATDGCAADADCAFTRFADGDCCPSLCAPRVVSKQSAEALQAWAQACKHKGACPERECRPPPQATVPVCDRGHCAARPVGND